MQPDTCPTQPALAADERTLLNAILSGPGRSLDELAAACNTDILSLSELLLTPRFQAALDTIRRAAAALTDTRALACGQVALATLSAACENTDNPAERRRAAAALSRYLPKPARTSEPSAAAVQESAAPSTAAAPELGHNTVVEINDTPRRDATSCSINNSVEAAAAPHAIRARDRPSGLIAA